MPYTVIIPARLASTRLKNKVMLPILDKPILQHVYERAIDSGADRVIIATEDDEIIEAAKCFNAETVKTKMHPNGTLRIQEACAILQLEPETIVVGLQGDEPAINPALIQQCADKIATYPQQQKDNVLVTAAAVLDKSQWHDPAAVKVAIDNNDHAMYFSRAAIGGNGCYGNITSPIMHHIGIYAYTVASLNHMTSLPPCKLEETARLEQFRALTNGFKIPVVRFDGDTGFGIDTEADYQHMCELFNQRT